LILSTLERTQTMSTQLEIAECGTNVALRYAFQVPVYSKTGKLAGFKLVRIVRSNLIEDCDLAEFLGGDINKLAQEFMQGTIARVIKREGLPSAAHVTFRGIDVCRHRACTVPADDDPRWT